MFLLCDDGISIDDAFSIGSDEALWPVVVLFTLNVYLLAIPDTRDSKFQDDATPNNGNSIGIDTPCVTAAVVFLHDIAKLLIPFSPSFNDEAMNELQCYLTSMIPFGSPVESNPKIIKRIHNSTGTTYGKHKDFGQDKCSAWKPFTFKGRSEVIEISLIESVHGGKSFTFLGCYIL